MMKILVADDNADSREMIREFLAAWGFEVLEACNGAETVAKVRQWSPDLVLMDLQMPFLDGYAVIEQIRRHERARRVPVIAITALAMQSNRERALAAGFDAYISKPLDFRSLRNQLKELLSNGSVEKGS